MEVKHLVRCCRLFERRDRAAMTWRQNPAQLVIEPFLLPEYSRFDTEFGQSPSRLRTDTHGAPRGAETLLETG